MHVYSTSVQCPQPFLPCHLCAAYKHEASAVDFHFCGLSPKLLLFYISKEMWCFKETVSVFVLKTRCSDRISLQHWNTFRRQDILWVMKSRTVLDCFLDTEHLCWVLKGKLFQYLVSSLKEAWRFELIALLSAWYSECILGHVFASPTSASRLHPL